MYENTKITNIIFDIKKILTQIWEHNFYIIFSQIYDLISFLEDKKISGDKIISIDIVIDVKNRSNFDYYWFLINIKDKKRRRFSYGRNNIG